MASLPGFWGVGAGMTLELCDEVTAAVDTIGGKCGAISHFTCRDDKTGFKNFLPSPGPFHGKSVTAGLCRT